MSEPENEPSEAHRLTDGIRELDHMMQVIADKLAKLKRERDAQKQWEMNQRAHELRNLNSSNIAVL
jgi:hypothetical protein